MSRSRIVALVSIFTGLLALTTVFGALAFPMAGTAWAASQPLKIEGDVQRPLPIHRVPPVYPEEARKNRVEGQVVLKMVVDERGKVQNPTIAESSGNAGLDQAALAAIPDWTFKAATLHGRPVAVHFQITLVFRLDK